MYSEVDIAVMALGHIGIGQEIEDLAATGHLERVCNRFFDQARNEVLERVDWPVTTKQVALGLNEEEPNGDWLRAYDYPDNLLILRRIVSPAGLPVAEPIPFKVGLNADNEVVIFTDESSAIAEGTFLIESPATWAALFAKAVSWNLATYICGPLGKGAKRGECVGNFEKAITEATGTAVRQNQNKPRPPSTYTSCR